MHSVYKLLLEHVPDGELRDAPAANERQAVLEQKRGKRDDEKRGQQAREFLNREADRFCRSARSSKPPRIGNARPTRLTRAGYINVSSARPAAPLSVALINDPCLYFGEPDS